VSRVSKNDGRIKRHKRIRKTLAGSLSKPRLAVFRSNSYIYAQLIDDDLGQTIVSASSLEKDFRSEFKGKLNKNVATTIGKTIGSRAVAKGIKKVVFDRGGYIYHGKIKSLADAAREAGLEF